MHTYIRISNHDTQHNKNFQGFCELLRLCMAKQDKTFSAFWCKSKVHLSSNILLWDIKKEILELTSVFTDIYKYESSYYFFTQVYLKMKCFGLKAFAILELLFHN